MATTVRMKINDYSIDVTGESAFVDWAVREWNALRLMYERRLAECHREAERAARKQRSRDRRETLDLLLERFDDVSNWVEAQR